MIMSIYACMRACSWRGGVGTVGIGLMAVAVGVIFCHRRITKAQRPARTSSVKPKAKKSKKGGAAAGKPKASKKGASGGPKYGRVGTTTEMNADGWGESP